MRLKPNGTPDLSFAGQACFAPAIPAILAVAAVASAAAAAYGTYQQGQAQSAASRANANNARVQGEVAAQQAAFNARQAEMQARQAADAANLEERKSRERARFLMGDQAAAFGAAGVQMEGSPLEALGFSAGQAELDALAIRQQGQTQVGDYMMTAELQRYRGTTARMGQNMTASLDDFRASQAASAGTARAGGELLSSAGSWYRNYGQAAFG